MQRPTPRQQGDAGGLYRVAGPLISAQVSRSIGGDVKRLRDLLAARNQA